MKKTDKIKNTTKRSRLIAVISLALIMFAGLFVPVSAIPQVPDGSDTMAYQVQLYTETESGGFTLHATNRLYGKPGGTVSPVPPAIDGYATPARKSIVLSSTGMVVKYYYYLRGTVSGSMNAMINKVNTIYKLIRNNICFPILVLSFASCGFRILGAGFTGTKGLEAAKQQIIGSLIAFLVLMLLPSILNGAVAMFKSNAWVPPGVVLIPY